MIAFHGTTDRSAKRIAEEGFLPKKPSKRVWFAQSRHYALGRAKTKARRAHARPVVLACELDLPRLRQKLGPKKVRCRNGIIAVDGEISADVVRSGAEPLDHPSSPRDLADWVNGILGLKVYKGAGARHPGILRLAQWVANREGGRGKGIKATELLHMARQWLPELFEGVEIDPEKLRVFRRMKPRAAEGEPDLAEADPREIEAIDLLEDARPRRRARGLALLAELGEADLFEWCTMYLDDESVAVRLAALRAMARCDDGEPGVLLPLAESSDKRLRAAAIAALTRHAGRDAPRWFERGLKDPSACVRRETAAMLGELDPAQHRRIFDLARHDPNPEVARLARKLTAGKGYPRMTFRRDEAIGPGRSAPPSA